MIFFLFWWLANQVPLHLQVSDKFVFPKPRPLVFEVSDKYVHGKPSHHVILLSGSVNDWTPVMGPSMKLEMVVWVFQGLELDTSF